MYGIDKSDSLVYGALAGSVAIVSYASNSSHGLNDFISLDCNHIYLVLRDCSLLAVGQIEIIKTLENWSQQLISIALYSP